jgi:hypothetical protein
MYKLFNYTIVTFKLIMLLKHKDIHLKLRVFPDVFGGYYNNFWDFQAVLRC